MSNALNLLQLSEGHMAFGSQTLFEDASFAINEGEHVGVIGPNGAGKTTLFKILLGQVELDRGQIIRSKNLRLGYLSQHDLWSPEETGNSYLERECTLPVWQAKEKGRDLQVSEEVFAKPLLSLSGGYRMRIKLIGLLGRDPNLMLLDEPTNYLDLETTLLLERFLQNYAGAFLLISHDREVLRRTSDHTLEVESGQIVKYNGNIDDYFEQKELLRSQLEAQALNQAAKKKVVMDFVSRFGAKASKAKQAQSKLKSLERMEAIEWKPVPIRAAIKIPPPPAVGKNVLRLEDAEFAYGGPVVLRKANVAIDRGDHVAVVGMNGAGKSTLLKGLAGTLPPLTGRREVGYRVQLALFNQHVVEALDATKNVLQSLEEVASPDASTQEIRNMAGSLLFSDEAVRKKIAVLSGGEKSRVALGRVLLQRSPFLLLDEPTNHLDFQTVEALTQALNAYAGTLVVVSHDRGFVRRVGTKILEVADGHVHVYPGSYDEYVWKLQHSLMPSAPAPAVASAASSASASATAAASALATAPVTASPKSSSRDLSKRARQLDREIAKAEAEVAQLEKEIQELHGLVAGGGLDFAKLSQMTQMIGQKTESLAKAEARWLSLSHERETI
ncbi:MAG: ABC transporter ATP-binding protein [Bdellovibrio sp.]|nr:MAG: ABC transporter ATP-binding protein [Bdellovibrio sp.]